MAKQLERLGVDVVEAGFASASPGDFASVRQIAGGPRGRGASAHPHVPRHERHPFEARAQDDAESRARSNSQDGRLRARQVRRGGVLRRGRLAHGPRLPLRGGRGGHQGGRVRHQPPRHRRLRHPLGSREDGGGRQNPRAEHRQGGDLDARPRRPRPRRGQLPRGPPRRGAPGGVHDLRHRRARWERRARGDRDGPQHPRRLLRARARHSHGGDRPHRAPAVVHNGLENLPVQSGDWRERLRARVRHTPARRHERRARLRNFYTGVCRRQEDGARSRQAFGAPCVRGTVEVAWVRP